MGQKQENLKLHFTALIDDLIVQDDIIEMKADVARIQSTLETSVAALREEFAKSLETFSTDLLNEIATIRSEMPSIQEPAAVPSAPDSEALSALNTKIEEKANLFNSGFTLLAEKVAESFKKQRSDYDALLKELTDRIARDEQRLEAYKAEQQHLLALINDIAAKQTTPAGALFDSAVSADNSFDDFEEFAAKSTKAMPQTVETLTDSIVLDSMNTQEFEIDLSEIEFTTTGHGNSSDIYIDASGQHLYKP